VSKCSKPPAATLKARYLAKTISYPMNCIARAERYRLAQSTPSLMVMENYHFLPCRPPA